ncbi:MAG: ATP-binding protein [Bacteroidota bacterium]
MGEITMNKDLTSEEQFKLVSAENRRMQLEIEKLNEEKKSLLRRLQASEEAVEKLEHLSTFSESASEISHEINNPVNFVSGSLSIIKRGVNDFIELINMYKQLQGFEDQPLYQKLKTLEEEIDIELTKRELTDSTMVIEKGMERIHEISHNLSLLGKREAATPIKLDVNQSITDTLMLAKERAGESIEIRADLGNIPEIMSYRGKLNQVFTNIIKNAVEAIQAKPDFKAEYIDVNTELHGDKVRVSIRDTGNGMTEEAKEKIFDKFYTTKSAGKGNGLGMGVCLAIVKKHNGSIEVESEKGKGTTILITLPLKH